MNSSRSQPRAPRGVICGTDAGQEWLLPWWWSRYTDHNSLPVTFFDFGMTQKGREWCEKRGAVMQVPFDPSLITSREEIDPERIVAWEAIYGKSVWQARRAWFQKPFALLATPYQRSIWIDLDCEILAPIAPLFDFWETSSQIGIVREFRHAHLPRFHPDILYNGGVIVFEPEAPLIASWAREALQQNHRFWGDDPLLSHLIHTERIEVVEIPEIWNWRISQGFNITVAILHWVGCAGKGFLKAQGGLKPALEEFYHSLKGDHV